jgi:hypothetical protein
MRIARRATSAATTRVSRRPSAPPTVIVRRVNGATARPACRSVVRRVRIVRRPGDARRIVAGRRWCVSPTATVRFRNLSASTTSARTRAGVSRTANAHSVEAASTARVCRFRPRSVRRMRTARAIGSASSVPVRRRRHVSRIPTARAANAASTSSASKSMNAASTGTVVVGRPVRVVSV